MPLTVDPKYGPLDADSQVFLQCFDAPAGAHVVELGCNEEYVSNILTDNGYLVTGYDLRAWQQEIPPNYERIQGDFALLADSISANSVDVVVALSALEHFGIGAYGAGSQPYLDVVAMDHARRILKPGGVAYVSVPFGMCHLEVYPQWRVFDSMSVRTRIVQRLNVEAFAYFTSGPAVIDGKYRKSHQSVTEHEARHYDGSNPSVTIMLKLRKLVAPEAAGIRMEGVGK